MDENAVWNEWKTTAQPILTDIFYGKTAPEQGLKEIQKEVHKVLDENK